MLRLWPEIRIIFSPENLQPNFGSQIRAVIGGTTKKDHFYLKSRRRKNREKGLKKGESEEDLGDLRQRVIPAAGMRADTSDVAKTSHIAA